MLATKMPAGNLCRIMIRKLYYELIIIIPADSKLALLRNVSCGFSSIHYFFQELQNVVVSMSISEIPRCKILNLTPSPVLTN